MKLQDIYDQLAFGELRLLNLGSGNIDSDTSNLPEESFERMFPTIQLGLTELHKKFTLREDRIIVPLVDGKVSYVLKKRVDAPAGFQENLLKIERIYGTWRERRYEIPLNRLDNRSAIRTTSVDTLLVPDDDELAPWLKETAELDIVYRADHPKIRKERANSSPLATEIDLPTSHLQALLYFIASRMYNPVGMSNEMHEGNNFAMKYEAEIAKLVEMNYEIDDDANNNRIIDNGWV